MSRPVVDLTPQQLEKEKAILLAIVLDTTLLVFYATAGLLSGSMTALSEIVRCTLLLMIEYVSYAVLRRAHRGRFREFEYGTGKIERITNLLVAFGLLLSCLYLFAKVVSVGEDTPLSTNSLMLTMILTNINFILNYYCSVSFIRSNREESSVIMSSQIAARIAKTVVSGVVFGILVFALWLPDPQSARMVDLAGSIFLIGYMAVIAYGLIRESLPEILDRTIPEPEHFQILRILTEHFDNYDGFTEYKARRSGKDLFILLKLGYYSGATLQQIEQRLAPIRAAFASELPGSSLTIEPEIMEEFDNS
ncbi:cation transporter [Pseudodesulfovibrio sp.]|nr:cation transporter [Pseudodesulfovibrio sp.]